MQYSKKTLALAVEYLESGKVISFPTETVYALACAATDHEAINKIVRIKQRASSKVFAILVENMQMMARYAYLDERIIKLIDKFSSKPVTCVLNYKPSNHYEVCSALVKDGKIGIRIPNHKIAQDILHTYRKAIVATSVNLTGQPSATSVDEMPEEVKAQIDLVIDGGRCDLGIASTVVDFTCSEPRILR